MTLFTKETLIRTQDIKKIGSKKLQIGSQNL